MRKLDYNGLMLCKYQGELFEKSLELDCSTPIFMRRFMNSKLAEKIDINETAFIVLDPNEGLYDLSLEYGKSSYGKIKYSKNSMFWIGYMYRYMSYTREESTYFLMKTFDYKKMNEVYYPFHTQDPEWVVESLLELYNLDPNYLDKNYRLKRLMEPYYKELSKSLNKIVKKSK